MLRQGKGLSAATSLEAEPSLHLCVPSSQPRSCLPGPETTLTCQSQRALRKSQASAHWRLPLSLSFPVMLKSSYLGHGASGGGVDPGENFCDLLISSSMGDVLSM